MPLNAFDEMLPELGDAHGFDGGVLSSRILRCDLRELERIAKRRGDGCTVPMLLAEIIHSGTLKLVETEA